MDERQRVVKKTFTKEQLEGMSVEDIATLVGEVGKGTTFTGTGLVRKKDGSVRYAPEAIPGEFGESPEDLKAEAAK